MAATINTGSAKIIVDNSARPGIEMTEQRVICHLTSGFSSEDSIGHAFTANGSVNVSAKPGDLVGWDFGFIQFHKVNFVATFYAGRTTSQGAVAIQAHIPPATLQPLTLDSEADITPWTKEAGRRFRNVPGKITASTGDHPLFRAPLEVTNQTTGEKNLILEVIDNRDLWTVFTAQDPTHSNQYLAHFRWSLRNHYKFVWRAGRPAAINHSSFKIMDPVSGPPPEGELASLLANPRPPHSNPTSRLALRNAVLGGPPNREDLREWFRTVPGDFFVP